MAWGDYDNDGRLDILLAGNTGSNGITQVWRNTSSGFTNIQAGLPGVTNASVAWGDYDNDGRLDILLTGKTGSNRISQVWRNTGNRFTNINAGLPGVDNGSVAWGDYDNDGKLDILLTGNTGAYLSTGTNLITQVWRNTGSGFTDIQAGLPGVEESSVAWGDYDNDGRLDILMIGHANAARKAWVWWNTGSAFITNIDTSQMWFYNGGAAWGDYDNDGNLDILMTGMADYTHQAQVWRNTGSGFSNIDADLAKPRYGSARWGDYNNDGRLDILLTGLDTVTSIRLLTQLYQNTGSGFTNIEAGLPGVADSSAAWGDYDNDGRLDVLVAGNTFVTRITQVWTNLTAASNSPPTAPTGLAAEVTGRGVLLRWQPAQDVETPASGLTYNLRVGSTPGAGDIVSPQATSSGQRLLPEMGNAQERLWSMLTNLPPGTHYWSVQAIDSAFAGSPFAEEQTFAIAPVITGIAHAENEEIQLQFLGGAGESYTLQTSPDLVEWSDVITLTAEPTTGVFHYTGSTNGPTRFYRLKQP